MIRVNGNYDHSVAESSRAAPEKGLITGSDTFLTGLSRSPALVMLGYTARVSEAPRYLSAPPHVFGQAALVGVAAAVAGHFSVLLGGNCPFCTILEPRRQRAFPKSLGLGIPPLVDHCRSNTDGDVRMLQTFSCRQAHPSPANIYLGPAAQVFSDEQ
ncbi:hypothetical protein [Bradyrhizobium yuanmingense]|uniref:hypothetical protein n=1 Tax=Bradyrhizobium yuanmingense TaxID=108015 RepID=UPI0023B8F272|nr:hypothetical protein [Bradyrhizobium yuanmingense]MDF0581970.1 hypothetical protein [Bradyrhizobium yuanmingense]